jgi:hypothetical protein
MAWYDIAAIIANTSWFSMLTTQPCSQHNQHLHIFVSSAKEFHGKSGVAKELEDAYEWQALTADQ